MKISIIVSCYNQGCYLAETLDSVLAQTFGDWECIIIDDGSVDNTALVAKEYLNRDKRFKYIYQENQGVCIARNHAISCSKGEYILCLDSDDKISPTYTTLSVIELDKDKEVALVTCNYQYFGKSNKKIFLESYSIEKLMGHNLFINCSMFRRKDFDRVGGFNLNMKLGLEDWDFWLSLLENGAKVKYLNNIHFFYRLKEKQKSRNLSVALKNYDSLRKQIWLNHSQLYSSVYSPPRYSLEYIQVAYSKEYIIGKLILNPIRRILAII